MSLVGQCLDRLEAMVDLDHCEKVKQKHKAVHNFEKVSSLPVFISYDNPDWPSFCYKEVFEDKEKMLISELQSVYMGCLLKDDRVYTIRANLGIGIIPSLFGCKILMPQVDQKPWAEHLILNHDKIDELTGHGVPNLKAELGGKTFELVKFYKQVLGDYPNLSKAIHTIIPDTQGPFDLAHIIWGSGIYLATIDDPDSVHKVLNLVTDTYIEFSKLLKREINDEIEPGWHFHSGCYCKGGVRICDDSATNLSREMYREFCMPYNQKILVAFNGGWIHSCGSVHHYLEDTLSLKGLAGMNFGNPERYPLESYFENFADKKIPLDLFTLPKGKRPRDYPWIETGIIYHLHASSLEEAKRLID